MYTHFDKIGNCLRIGSIGRIIRIRKEAYRIISRVSDVYGHMQLMLLSKRFFCFKAKEDQRGGRGGGLLVDLIDTEMKIKQKQKF